MESLQKAMVSYGNSAQGQDLLAPNEISKEIHEKLREEFPLLRLLPTEQAKAPKHDYRVRSVMPDAWVQGELAEADFSSATYVNKQVEMKIVRTWNGVSGFMQQLSQNFVNALGEALETSVIGFGNTMEWLTLYGNSGDSYQFQGLLQQMIADSAGVNNVLDAGSAVITLPHLDTALSTARRYTNSVQDRWAFMMSPEMIDVVSGLQLKVRREVPQVEFEGGFTMASYKGVPILSSNLLNASATTSPAVTATAAAGGSLADDEYFYVIASVTADGELIPGTEDSATTATTNNSVALTWTADANAKNYVIFRGLATGVHTYLTTIPAKTYDSAGKVSGNVAAWTDDGSITPVSTVKPRTSGDEMIVLANISTSSRGNKLMGSLSPLGDPIDQFVSYVPLATTNSAYRFMLEGFYGLKVPYPVTNYIIRNVDLTA